MPANLCAAVHRLDTDKEKAQYDQKIYHTGLYVFFGSDGRAGCQPAKASVIKEKFASSPDRIRRCVVRRAVIRALSQQVHIPLHTA